MEHHAKQGSPEWFNERRHVVVTASHIADAVGAGRGKPYDYLMSLFQETGDGDDNTFTQHGRDTEPIINEAYNLLTGHRTRNSGFWTIADEHNPLKGKIGASPDALVLDSDGKICGICEYKAPVYTMYSNIPKQYMIQMHAQMAVTGVAWCDFMAVCIKTKSIMFKRVHFCPQFWEFLSKRLLQFCEAYQEIRSSNEAANSVTSNNINAIRQWAVSTFSLPYESKIQTTDMLRKTTQGNNFIGPSKLSFNFDLLIGSDYKTSFTEARYQRELEKLDKMIESETVKTRISTV